MKAAKHSKFRDQKPNETQLDYFKALNNHLI